MNNEENKYVNSKKKLLLSNAYVLFPQLPDSNAKASDSNAKASDNNTKVFDGNAKAQFLNAKL